MSVYVWNTFCPTLFGTGALISIFIFIIVIKYVV